MFSLLVGQSIFPARTHDRNDQVAPNVIVVEPSGGFQSIEETEESRLIPYFSFCEHLMFPTAVVERSCSGQVEKIFLCSLFFTW
jgi:hypothetical protein